MVAYLQDGVVDDDRLLAKSSEKAKSAGLPPSHETALKWFYKDPQGEIQGKAGGKYFFVPDIIWIKCCLGTVLCAQVLSVTRRCQSGSRPATSPCLSSLKEDVTKHFSPWVRS